MSPTYQTTSPLTPTSRGLTGLRISNYALIEHLDIEFEPGFSVITGETGAGKSIMLGALGFLLGERADTKVVRPGEKKCSVEASFSIENLGLEAFFEENDLDYDEECLLRREISQTGKSRAFINDVPVTAGKLRELGSLLIDIHSQHQNLLLRRENFLLETLDAVAQRPELPTEFKSLHSKYTEARQTLARLQEETEKAKSEKEYLQFRLKQIDEAHLNLGEQEELEKEQQMLSHVEEIKQAYFSAQSLLENGETSLPSLLRQASEALLGVTDNFPAAGEPSARLESLQIELNDILADVNRQAEGIDYDPARLQFIEERLSTIYDLEQKHHVTSVEELLAYAEELRTRLSGIEDADENIAQLETEVQHLHDLRTEAAKKLTLSRQKAGQTIESELTSALQGLGMPHVQLKVRLTPRPEPDVSGADNVAFLFSANKNVEPKDISLIASGGEISRLMLSLKSLIACRRNLPTIIFDEIDTGVSGTMAERMARVMKQMSERCQVICITHLPQIAALGDFHFRVFKQEDDSGTHSHILRIDNAERVKEIAIMLSGETVTEAAIRQAQELLNPHR